MLQSILSGEHRAAGMEVSGVDLASLIERFPGLLKLDFVSHGFTRRVPDLDVRTDRATALERLRCFHLEAVAVETGKPLRLAKQVHGNKVAVVDRSAPEFLGETDGLLTDDSSVTLGVFVADCCAIYLADPSRRVIGILHSGKRGTALNIVGPAVRELQTSFGCDPAAIVAQLSPCIRPPHYEIDFASTITRQLAEAGIEQIYDCQKNTGSDLQHYYSYRMERGQTGRMLAFVALK